MIEKVPFMNLALQWAQVRDAVRPDLDKLFDDSAFTLGPWVEQFEYDIARYLNVKHAIGVNSGTSALHLAAICANLKPGDKVMVPAQTFIATAWGALYERADLILCDVDPVTGTIDPAELERRYEPAVKAIIPVHLFGQSADMVPIMAFAKKHNLIVIEDAAQSIGGTYQEQALGTIGVMGCFSFYPGKNLGAAGEAGLLVTNDDAIAKRARSLRAHGQAQRYIHDEIGYNYRMEGIQGLVLSHKLKHLDDWTAERCQLAAHYSEGLQDLPLTLPEVRNGESVWHLYVVRHENRDGLRDCLTSQQIETGLHYPVPLHRQPCFKDMGFDVADYPQADEWANNGLSLPLFVGMTQAQQDRVIAAVRDYLTDAKYAAKTA